MHGSSFGIGSVEDIGLGVARATRTAVSGRHGGVHLDVPGEVLGQVMEAALGPGRSGVNRPHPEAIAGPEATKKTVVVGLSPLQAAQSNGKD